MSLAVPLRRHSVSRICSSTLRLPILEHPCYGRCFGKGSSNTGDSTWIWKVLKPNLSRYREVPWQFWPSAGRPMSLASCGHSAGAFRTPANGGTVNKQKKSPAIQVFIFLGLTILSSGIYQIVMSKWWKKDTASTKEIAGQTKLSNPAAPFLNYMYVNKNKALYKDFCWFVAVSRQ